MKSLLAVSIMLATPIVAATGDDSDVLHPDYLNRISYIDSGKRVKALSDGLQTLIKAGETTAANELRQQLSRKQCAVRLSTASASTMDPIELYRRNRRAVVILGRIHQCGRCSKWELSFSRSPWAGRWVRAPFSKFTRACSSKGTSARRSCSIPRLSFSESFG